MGKNKGTALLCRSFKLTLKGTWRRGAAPTYEIEARGRSKGNSPEAKAEVK